MALQKSLIANGPNSLESLQINMKTEGLRLLYFGQATWGSTSLQRYSVLQGLFDCSYLVDSRRVFPDKKSGRTLLKSIQGRIGFGPLISLSSRVLMQEASRFKPDIIWVDGGFLLSKDAILHIKNKFKCQFIHYTPDSLSAPGISNRCMSRAISAYDAVITTKEQDFPIYKKNAAKKVIFSLQGYDPTIHRPIELSPDEKIKYNYDVSFVGEYMTDRAAAIEYLIDKLDISYQFMERVGTVNLFQKNYRRYFMVRQLGMSMQRLFLVQKLCSGFLIIRLKIHSLLELLKYQPAMVFC